MAGERIGKTYEALLKVALDRLHASRALAGTVFWNETPSGVVVEPDFTIGTDKDHPSIVILVTHSTTPNNSQMKCWRNLGELCDLKTSLSPRPQVINVIFDSIIKTDIKSLQDAAFDSQIIIGDQEYGPSLLKWVVDNESQLPTDQNEKACAIAHSSDPILRNGLEALAKGLVSAFSCRKPSLDELWEREAKRGKIDPPHAKNTYFRLGFMKRLLAGDSIDGKSVLPEDASWLIDLGIVSPSIRGYYISDNDLKWFIETPYAEKYKEIANLCASTGFLQQLRKIKAYSLMKAYGNYVVEHYPSLCTEGGMLQCLRKQYSDPTADLSIPDTIDKPDTVWIFDFLSSLSLANGARFGYPDFSRHPKANDSKIGNMFVGVWCSCFLTQYFTRKRNFKTPESAIRFAALVMSEQLCSIPVETIRRLNTSIVEAFLRKEYQTSMPSHRGFEPLFGLLLYERIVPNYQSKINLQACFAENAGLTGQAGRTPVAIVNNTLIKWQTATDAGRDHKRNELCGRVIGLKYTWDQELHKFIPRKGIKKLILFLDGTWRQKDIDALIAAGWDEIYYPDEIDKLKAAIV